MKKQIIDKYIELKISNANVKHFIRDLFEDNECIKLNKIKIYVM